MRSMAISLSQLRVRSSLLAALLTVGVTSASLAQGAATLDITPSGAAPAGTTVSVKWSGPNAPGDYITVVPKGAAPNVYKDYKTTNDGRNTVNPVSILLPAEPGAYEIRYVLSNARGVLAAVPYQVTGTVAAIDAPTRVAPGARFEISWTGPNNGSDWVTIVAPGAAPRAYGSYVDARNGRPGIKTGSRIAELRAPTEPGRYELRYVQQGTLVIGTRTIEVVAGGASSAAAGGAADTATPAGGAAQAGVTGSNTIATAGAATGKGTESGTAAGAAAQAGGTSGATVQTGTVDSKTTASGAQTKVTDNKNAGGAAQADATDKPASGTIQSGTTDSKTTSGATQDGGSSKR